MQAISLTLSQDFIGTFSYC